MHRLLFIDMRGTKKSEGKFTIWHSAGNDSYDTMQWVSTQSWSNGKIFQLGASADGLVTFATTKTQPQWLVGQWLIVSSAAGYPIIYGDGMYHQSLTEMWMRFTVPTQAKECIEEIKANEYPGQWWVPLNLTTEYWKVKWPAMMVHHIHTPSANRCVYMYSVVDDNSWEVGTISFWLAI